VWSYINSFANTVFELWLWPFQGLTPNWQIFVTALPVTVIALLIFRFASNQDGITAAKNKIKAYLLELWLYKDDIGVMLRAQGRVFRYSLVYMRYSLVPMAIMIVPFALVIVQLESQYAFQGIEPGESTILSVTLDGEAPASSMNAELSLPAALQLETPPLRIDASNQVYWRINALQSGRHRVGIRIGDHETTREIVAGTAGALWPIAYRNSDWRVLGSPAEASIADGSGIESTEISYARARGEFLGLSSASWLLLGFTLIFGFALRGLFGVTF
jgi:hypothetical protein